MSWLDYFLAYCAVGIVILLVMPTINGYLKRRRGEEESQPSSLRSLFESKPTTLGDKFIEWVLAPSVAISLVVVGWPFLIYFAIKEHLYPTKPYVEKVFQVEREHLGTPVEIIDIEAKEKVFDPLGAVPDVPFGHLNTAWREFTAQMADGDRLWTFSAKWQSDWGNPELRDGYVIVKPDAGLGAFFMTRWIILDKPAQAPEPEKPSLSARLFSWFKKNAD
jgi:hypothetical protein